jgi:preprotein translocase subunit YajC
MRAFFFQKPQHAMTKMVLGTDTLTILAQTQAAGPQSPLGGGSMMIVFYGLIMAAMYFLMIAPQRKKQKELEKMIGELQSGDEVMTSGGIYGTITNIKDDRFVIRIAENTKIEVAKANVSVITKKAAEEQKK